MSMLAAVALGAFLATFGGQWTCTPDGPGAPRFGTHWSIAAAPHSSWTRVSFSPERDGGTAYVGFLPYTNDWIYQDFHDDGSYSANTSPGPVGGVWTWMGSYTTAQRVAHYAVRWRRDGALIRRSFGRMIGPSFREVAADACVRR